MNTYFDSDPFYQIKDIAVCLFERLKFIQVFASEPHIINWTEQKSSIITSNAKI